MKSQKKSRRKVLAALQSAMDKKAYVDIRRKINDADVIRGYVVQLSDDWILIADTRDGGYLDGFTALRTKDITKVKRVDGFEPELLKKHKQWPPAAPEQPISLSSAEAIIRTAGEGRDALTIHQEKDKPDACFIGAPVDWGRKSVWLLEIDRHARWDTEMTKYRLKDITRIGFGGGYEDALLTVSGAKPDRRSGGHEGK
ncbi:hypothetical protein [Arthrobacter crystallopoietes]|uniref:hypothetical protein n=1 Tax=Crystallibacter crystallopoietes TaxID=37928 RepID=UPI001111384F|nr:hypothetical protein [Arthrobacter crystallopoietes]